MMNIWRFDLPDWTEDERRVIGYIVRRSTEMFSPGNRNRQEKFERYIVDHIEKNIKDIPEKIHEGHTSKELNEEFERLIAFLRSEKEYECYLNEIEKIWRRCEILGDNPRTLSEKEIIRILEGLEKLTAAIDPADKKYGRLKKKILNFRHFVEKMSFSDITTGSFSMKEEKITIYMRAILVCCGNADRDVMVEEVLVHELYHAMHYAFADSNIKRSWGTEPKEKYKKTVVKESLADYFAYTYMNSIAVEAGDEMYFKAADRLVDKWEKHDVSVFPYSGAKAFLKERGGNINGAPDDNTGGILFCSIKYDALNSWFDQYRIIMKSIKKGYEAGYVLFRKLNNLPDSSSK